MSRLAGTSYRSLIRTLETELRSTLNRSESTSRIEGGAGRKEVCTCPAAEPCNCQRANPFARINLAAHILPSCHAISPVSVMSKSRVASSNSSTSVTRLWHQPAAKWSSYLYFHLLVRLGVFLRRIRRRFGGIGAQAPAGPQNFQQLLEEHQRVASSTPSNHRVSVDWYLPASQDAFAGDAGKSYFDWSTSRILRFQPKRAPQSSAPSLLQRRSLHQHGHDGA